MSVVENLSSTKRALLERMLEGQAAPSGREAAIPRRSGAVVPLSPEQMNIFAHALSVSDPIYNEPITVRRTGPFDLAALEKAMNFVLSRHEAWRTAIEIQNNAPFQRIHADAKIELSFTDLTHLPADRREAEALSVAADEARQPLPLDTAPLMRGRVFKLAENDHRLYLVLHHVIFDGISLMKVFLPELASAYTAFAEGGELDLPAPPLQFGDYASWRARGPDERRLENDLAWWRAQLGRDLPDVVLPTDRSRNQRRSHEGGMEKFTLNAPLSASLRELSQREGTTLYATLLAAYKTLLHRLTGAEDLVVGGVTDTRLRPELEAMMGCFLNMIALRTRPSADLSFRTYLAEVQETVLGALDHSWAPFDRILRDLRLRRDPLRHPLFQAVFSMQPPPGAAESGWQLTQMDVATGFTKFDLYLELEERDEDILGRFLYSTELFDARSVRRLIRHWRNLLESIVLDLGCALGSLKLLDASDLAEIRARQLGPVLGAPHPTLTEWLDEQARAEPSAIAVEFEGETLSYRALHRRAESLARRLRRLGVGPDSLVALAIERNLNLPVCLLGILKAGGAWLPLDPGQPPARLADILKDATPALILTDCSSRDRLPPSDLRIVVADAPAADPVARPTGPAHEAIPDSLAYVIYTSGSTGRPKGVEISHRAIVNLLADMKRKFALGPEDRALAINPLSFDFSVAEVFLPLVSGARLIVARREDALDPMRLSALANRARATLLQGTPATWRGLVNAGWQGRRGLKIVSGGEDLPRDLAEALITRGDVVWNVYGPTETTVFAVVHKVEHGEGRVPIGRPVANTRIHILDKSGAPVPDGVQGELYIGGPGLARGFRNDPGLTAKRFLRMPSAGRLRLYRTGDIVRRRGNGLIEWCGRTDNQVKVRGFRIGLEEIEAALGAHEHIAFAAVRTWPDVSGEMSLCAYVVAKNGVETSPRALQSFLRRKLPDYMVPQRVVRLARMPMTVSGKIDRKHLPEPRALEMRREPAEPRTPLECKLAESWAHLLGVPRVGIHDNFFELGGHSVLAFLAMLEVKKIDGRELPLATLLEHPTVAGLAGALSETAEASFSHIVPLRRDGRDRPFFLVHGALGNVVAFKDLADRIVWDRPVYAVQAKGVDPRETPHETIDEAASAYVEAIRELQPAGPYALGGYSYGGLIAYEMACKFRDLGEEVDFLALLDTDIHPRNLPLANRVLYHASVPLRLARKLAAVPLLSWPAYLRKRAEIALNRLLIRLDLRERGKPLNEWSEPLPESSERMYEISLRAFLGFRPRAFESTVHFFRATERTFGECEPLPAWKRAAARVEVHLVDGAHGTMLSDHHVDSLAEAIARANAPRAPESRLSRAPVVRASGSRPRALLVTSLNWPSTSRLALSLKESGFDVAAVMPPHHLLKRIGVLEAAYRFHEEHGAASISRAVRAFDPDLLLPADETSVVSLHALHRCAGDLGEQALQALIERSLGNPRFYGTVESRAAVMAAAEAEGIAIPETRAIASPADLESFGAARMPLVLKLDGTSGGLGVRIVDEPSRLANEAKALVAPPWPIVLKDMVRDRSLQPLRDRLRPPERGFTVQSFVRGRCANRAVFAWEGEVLAGLSVEALATMSTTGSSSAVKIIDNRDMAEAAARLVRRLGLSGFCGFDFILEEGTGRAVLLELNPRATPSCHLAAGSGADMISMLKLKLCGAGVQRSQLRIGETVAYFPQEFWRDPASPHLRSAFHDVPWETPLFIELYLRRHNRWLTRFAPHVRGFWPSLSEKSIAALVPAKEAGP